MDDIIISSKRSFVLFPVASGNTVAVSLSDIAAVYPLLETSSEGEEVYFLVFLFKNGGKLGVSYNGDRERRDYHLESLLTYLRGR